MNTINVPSLVADLKDLPRLAYGTREEWVAWCSERGFGRGTNGHFMPFAFSDVATGLCTLRAYLRGRVHRHNAPEAIRDHNRSMREQKRYSEVIPWNRLEWNRDLAHKFAEFYAAVHPMAAVVGGPVTAG